MTLADRSNLLIKNYTRQQFPTLEEGVQRYIDDELSKIELTIESLARAAIQVADQEPENPVKGMVRYAISPWNPLGNGTLGLVYYNGTAWAAV